MERKFEIDVTPEGDLFYRPAVMRVRSGTTVVFTAGGRPFTALFFEKTPFERALFESKGGEGSQAARIVGPPGVYPFAVGVLHENRILLDPKCPEIIIQ